MTHLRRATPLVISREIQRAVVARDFHHCVVADAYNHVDVADLIGDCRLCRMPCVIGVLGHVRGGNAHPEKWSMSAGA
jgi:hypothetical protein